LATANGCSSTSVGPERQRSPQRFLAGSDAAGDRHDLRHHALFLEAHRLFHGDFVERIHRHLHVRRVDSRPIRLHPNLDVEVDDALDRDQDFHGDDRTAEKGGL
jgi:hypothetical protein